MSSPEILPVNFTVSEAAKRAAEKIRADYDAKWPDNPAAVLFVGWGITMSGTERRSENVIVGYYQQSDLAAVAHGIQEASGVKLVFFVADEFHAKFEAKVLDYARDRGFFLRGQ